MFNELDLSLYTIKYIQQKKINKFNEIEIRKIREGKKNGLTDDQLAEMFSCTVSNIRKIVSWISYSNLDSDIKDEYKSTYIKKYLSNIEIRAIREDRKNGAYLRDLAKKYRRTCQCISAICKWKTGAKVDVHLKNEYMKIYRKIANDRLSRIDFTAA